MGTIVKRSDKEIALSLGNAIRETRIQYKVTLGELARSVIIRTSTLSNIERGIGSDLKENPSLFHACIEWIIRIDEARARAIEHGDACVIL